METSTDRVLGNRLQLMQPRDGYRAAIDPVLLAAAVPAKSGERVLDLGCGVGTAALCLAGRVAGVAVHGIDLQPALVALAVRNAAANGLADRASFESGDLLGFKDRAFDHVLANPPYLARATASISPNPIKAMANVEGDAKLTDWVACAIAAAKDGGSVTFIHRADRAPELRACMMLGLGSLHLLPLLPRADAAAKRILLQGIKGAPAGFQECAPWPLHEADGTFTAATQAILRDAAALPLRAPA
ncbi:tRNA1(Val) (adenine(37)-N6)-methyltransferase [Dongia sp.]|uniref:tRNA1(Val) (adenine(37)-N6)-methyltransferase n=1 Tax=Dongia sp. TaxID=1977262 RepID=UPI0035AE5696